MLKNYCFLRCPSWPTVWTAVHVSNNFNPSTATYCTTSTNDPFPVVTSCSSLMFLSTNLVSSTSSSCSNRARFFSYLNSSSMMTLADHPSPMTPKGIIMTPPSSQQCTPVNSKTVSANMFRFPPWSGPSPRAASSPGLIPSAPASPTQR